ncbi:MAG: carbon-nitrogen hydrolase family protein [Desulfurococcales archaeon]|nr:carbon-nitrogen hydrolase family protein [Desulfurococcales archaeon]
MTGELHIAVLHGSVKAARGGPSYSHNIHRFVNLVTNFIEEAKANNNPIHLIVSHAFPASGNIPEYIRDRERAKSRIKYRSTTLNLKTMGQGSPVRLLRKVAINHNVNILYGPLYEVAGPRNYETTVLIKPDGGIEKYRKITLTPVEESLGLTCGKTPGVFDLVDYSGNGIGRIGVFIDEDMFNPLIFKAFEMSKVDIVIGHAMPYTSRYLPQPKKEGYVVTMKHCLVDKILTARSMDAKSPLVLVGGVLNVYTSSRRLVEKHWMPTTIVDPEDPENDVCLSPATAKSTSRPFLTADDVDKFKRVIVELNDDKDGSAGDCERAHKWFKKICSSK